MKRWLSIALVVGLLAAATSPLWSEIHSVETDLDDWINYRTGVSIGSQTKVWRSVAVDTVLADADIIDFRFHRQMMIRVVSGSITTLTPYVEGATDGTAFEIIYDKGGTQISHTVSGTGWYVIDEELFPSGAVKFVGDADGTIDVVLKG